MFSNVKTEKQQNQKKKQTKNMLRQGKFVWGISAWAETMDAIKNSKF